MFEQYPVAYCMNVHPATDLEQLHQNIAIHAVNVKNQLAAKGIDRPLGLGLWFPAEIATKLTHSSQLDRLRSTIEDNELVVTTLNGFPYGNFHQETVKHAVYSPDWTTPARLEYTLQLVEILHQLLPNDREGSISTLPLGWPSADADQDAFLERCEQQLHIVASQLDSLQQNTGRRISLCIEPEPGCLLGSAEETCRFFEHWIFENRGPNWKQEYLTVCHDICHSAVMNESQADVIRNYDAVGIDIGKVQVSSAPIARFHNAEQQNGQLPAQGILEQLRAFDEQRYLHQTNVCGEKPVFYEDLGLALEHETEFANAEWRIHFHLPIFLDRIGLLETSQSDIGEAVAALQPDTRIKQFEIETYAWNVLPQRDQFESLEAGIAEEIAWFYQLVDGLTKES